MNIFLKNLVLIKNILFQTIIILNKYTKNMNYAKLPKRIPCFKH